MKKKRNWFVRLFMFFVNCVKNHFGNQLNGEFEHSLKKLAFSFCVYFSLVVPLILLNYDKIKGPDLLSFYKIIIPVLLSLYTGGKFIDFHVNKNNRNGENDERAEHKPD